MKARVTVTADVNILALHRMLAENGLWLVHVHEKNIVHAVRVPRAASIEDLVTGWVEESDTDSVDNLTL